MEADNQTRERCKTLAGFIKEAWHVLEPTEVYTHGWHIDAVAAHLEAITFGTFIQMGLPNRVIFNQPPGTMKSLIVSVFWQAWEWGPCVMPHLRYFSTSYKDIYVARDSRKTRNLIMSDWYRNLWPHVKLVRFGETSFENTMGGNREGVPFKSMTGGRGHRTIVDDPHSIDTAESDVERASAARTFRESVTTRLIDARTSAIVIMMQRLHEQDVSGVALGLGNYIHLRLPMEFEAEKPAKEGQLGGPCETPIFRDPRTKEGELLFPERFPRDVVERDKKALGSHATAGQLQQRPTPRGGGMFKRENFRFVEELPSGPYEWVRGWDLAGTDQNKSPWTAGVKLGKHLRNGRYIVAHVARIRGTPGAVETLITTTAKIDQRSVSQDLPQDPGQAGKHQIQYYVKKLAGFKVRWSRETGSKPDRAQPFASQVEAGNVDVLLGDWTEAYVDELVVFPSGSWSDQVDGTSRAFMRLHRSQTAVIGGARVLK